MLVSATIASGLTRVLDTGRFTGTTPSSAIAACNTGWYMLTDPVSFMLSMYEFYLGGAYWRARLPMAAFPGSWCWWSRRRRRRGRWRGISTGRFKVWDMKQRRRRGVRVGRSRCFDKSDTCQVRRSQQKVLHVEGVWKVVENAKGL